MIFVICCESYPRMSFRVTSIASPWVARTGRHDHRRDIRFDFSRGKEPVVWIVLRSGPVHRGPMSSRRSWATSALLIPICFRGYLFCSWRYRVFEGRLTWDGSSRWIGLHYFEDSKSGNYSVELLLTDTLLGEFPRFHAQLETALTETKWDPLIDKASWEKSFQFQTIISPFVFCAVASFFCTR